MSERLNRLSKAINARRSAPATVGGGQTLDLLRALGACGLDPDALCRDTGLDPHLLAAAEARVPARIVAALFAAAEVASGDPLIGLHAAERATPRGPLLYLMLAGANVEASLRTWERFARIPISSLHVQLDVTESVATVAFDLDDAALQASGHLAEYLLLAVFKALALAAGGEQRPLRVELGHAVRGDAREIARLFGSPVRFGQPRHALVFHRRDLSRPSRLANPAVAAQLAATAAALDRQMTVRATWRERVADATRALLVTGARADRAAVARLLHTSASSLHRALREERTTFREVRDAEVWSVARALLASPEVKIEAVAVTVGFADGASFAKAFKRHAGASPKAYRDAVGRAAAGPHA